MLKGKELLTRPVPGKSRDLVSAEWDQIAQLRHTQITEGKDISFNYVLKPTILNLLEGCNLDNVLDLGCGTGELTSEIARISGHVTGVELSSSSIEIAERTCSCLSNISLVACSVEDFAERWVGPKFGTAIANMTLMTCLGLDSFVDAAANLVVPNGHFVATITHPWFWPVYWGYAEAAWFDYSEEIVIEAPFRISAEDTDCVTTHVHRSLSTYQHTLARAGFLIEQIFEPYPDEDVHSLYPERWKFPRFLAFRARRKIDGI